MSHLPWMPFYFADWKRSRKVRAMPRHCRSMFLDLLGELWEQGPIPDDELFVAGLLSEEPKSFRPLWPKIRAALFEIEPGMLSSEFLEEVRREQLRVNKLQSNRAKTGWETRRRRAIGQSSGNAAALPQEGRGYEISDLRSQKKISLSAREVSDGWMNGGLVGTLSGSHVEVLQEALEQAGLHPLPAFRAWSDLLRAWRESGRSVIIKQTPAKFIDHLNAGFIAQVIAGEIDPAKILEGAKRTQGRPEPGGRQPGRTDKTYEEVEAEYEALREQERRQRAAGGLP